MKKDFDIENDELRLILAELIKPFTTNKSLKMILSGERLFSNFYKVRAEIKSSDPLLLSDAAKCFNDENIRECEIIKKKGHMSIKFILEVDICRRRTGKISETFDVNETLDMFHIRKSDS